MAISAEMIKEIMEAVGRDDAARVLELHSRVPHIINCVDESGYSPLVLAAEFGSGAVITGLLGLGANVNFFSAAGGHIEKTALMAASIAGATNIVEILVEANADVNLHPRNGDAPIILAAQNFMFKTVRFLATHGADTNARNTVSDNSGRSPLHYAALKDDLETVLCLLDNGADINLQDEDGLTPLMLADHPSVIYHLLTRGANTTLRCNEESDEEYLARVELYPKYFYNAAYQQQLLKMIHNPNVEPEVIEEFLKRNREKINLDIRDIDGNALLHLVMLSPNEKLTQLYYSGKQVEDIKATYERRALLVQLLIRNGANPNIQNNAGQLPLHMAVGYEDNTANQEIFDLLFKPQDLESADIKLAGEASNLSARDTIDLRIASSRFHILSNLSVKDVASKTPWNIALQAGNVSPVQLLLAAGVAITPEDLRVTGAGLPYSLAYLTIGKIVDESRGNLAEVGRALARDFLATLSDPKTDIEDENNENYAKLQVYLETQLFLPNDPQFGQHSDKINKFLKHTGKTAISFLPNLRSGTSSSATSSFDRRPQTLSASAQGVVKSQTSAGTEILADNTVLSLKRELQEKNREIENLRSRLIKISRIANFEDKRTASAIQQPSLTGKMPTTEERVNFEENLVKADGNCGFTTLGVGREVLCEKLLSLKNNIEARKFLSEEIRSAFSPGSDLKPINEEDWKAKSDDYNVAESRYREFLTKSRDRHDKKRVLTPEKLIEKLERENNKKEAEELARLAAQFRERDQALTTFCETQEVFEYYIRHLMQDKVWLGYKSALLYAKEANISLYIWRKDNKNELECIHHHNAGESKKNLIHMLHTGGFTHFNILSLSGEKDSISHHHQHSSIMSSLSPAEHALNLPQAQIQKNASELGIPLRFSQPTEAVAAKGNVQVAPPSQQKGADKSEEKRNKPDM